MADPLDDQLGKVNELNSAVAKLQQALLSLNGAIDNSSARTAKLTSDTSKLFTTASTKLDNLTRKVTVFSERSQAVFNLNIKSVDTLTKSVEKFGNTFTKVYSRNIAELEKFEKAFSKKSQAKQLITDINTEVEKLTTSVDKNSKKPNQILNNKELQTSLDTLEKVKETQKEIQKKSESGVKAPGIASDLSSPTGYRVLKGYIGGGQFAKDPNRGKELTQIATPQEEQSKKPAKSMIIGSSPRGPRKKKEEKPVEVSRLSALPDEPQNRPEPTVEKPTEKTTNPIPELTSQLPKSLSVEELQIHSNLVRISGQPVNVYIEGTPILNIPNLQVVQKDTETAAQPIQRPVAEEKTKQTVVNNPRAKTPDVKPVDNSTKAIQDLTKTIETLDAQILALSLRQQQYGMVSYDTSKVLLDDALDYTNLLNDQTKALKFQQVERERLRKINRGLVNDAFLINSTTYESLEDDKQKEKIILRQKQIRRDLVDLEYIRTRLIADNPEMQMEINNGIEKQKEGLIQANKEYEKQLNIISRSNSGASRAFNFLGENLKFIPGLKKYAESFKKAEEASKKQALANAQIRDQREQILKANEKLLKDNRELEKTNKAINALGKDALKTGKGLDEQTLKDERIQKIVGKNKGTVAAGLLNKQLATNKATQEHNKSLVTSNKEMLKSVKSGNSLLAGMKSMGGVTKFIGAYGLIIGGILAGLKGIWSFMMKIDEQNATFAHQMNMTKKEASLLRFELFKAADNINPMVDRLNGAVKQMGQFADETGIISKNVAIFNTTLDTTARRLGMNEQQTAQFAKNILAAGSSTEKYRKELLGAAKSAQYANGANIQLQSTMQDVLKVTAAQTLSMGKQPGIIGKTVGMVRALGLSMATLEATAGSLLQFEDSIGAEMEAELFLGKQLNLERARAAAATNDYSTLAAELSDQMGTSAEFAKMNRFQQESLAKAMGMQRDELAQILLEQDSIRAAGFETAAARDKEYERLKKIYGQKDALRILGDKEFEREMKNVSFQEKLNTLLDNMKDIFVESIQPAVQELIDSFESQEGTVRKIFQAVKDIGAKVGDIILGAVKWLEQSGGIDKIFESINDKVDKTVTWLQEAGLYLEDNFIPLVEKIGRVFKGVGQIINGLVVAPIKAVGHLLVGIFQTFGSIVSAVKAFFTGDWTAAGQMWNDAGNNLALGIASALDVGTGVISGVGTMMGYDNLNSTGFYDMVSEGVQETNSTGRYDKLKPSEQRQLAESQGYDKTQFASLLAQKDEGKKQGTITKDGKEVTVDLSTLKEELTQDKTTTAAETPKPKYEDNPEDSESLMTRRLREEQGIKDKQTIKANDFTIQTNPEDTLVMAGGTQFGKETNDLLQDIKQLLTEYNNRVTNNTTKGNVYLNMYKVGEAWNTLEVNS